jgi:thiamine kinase-like enzyme
VVAPPIGNSHPRTKKFKIPIFSNSTMKKQEIVRLARICLPKLGLSSDDIHDESDIHISTLCSLWAGMGHIYKVTTAASPSIQFVVKHVAAPRNNKNQSLGDQRKAESYQVEASFYEKLAPELISKHGITLPQPLHIERDVGKGKNEIVICMSYVENRPLDLYNEKNFRAVLEWLAKFHASYWGHERVDAVVQCVGLQTVGTYWHLDTRPDEHAAMPKTGWEGRLKRAARAIDERLKRDPMQCLVHGDTKDANILMHADGTYTMCDFQYCGKGPPSKDLAYFFYSSVSPEDEHDALTFYLATLRRYLPQGAGAPTLEDLITSVELAYCDLYRFLSGWGFWGNDDADRVKRVLDRLDGGKDLRSEEAYDIAIRREFG